ncbi:MAG: energy transducer TonB [Deltaproteobacteria bacterium]|nr:energy transducer TonB [Deltaproteobacteria bacterium]
MQPITGGKHLIYDGKEEELERKSAAFDLNSKAYDGQGYGNRIMALVEITIGRNGIINQRIYRSSGFKTFDRAALHAMRDTLKSPSNREKLPSGPAMAVYTPCQPGTSSYLPFLLQVSHSISALGTST